MNDAFNIKIKEDLKLKNMSQIYLNGKSTICNIQCISRKYKAKQDNIVKIKKVLNIDPTWLPQNIKCRFFHNVSIKSM